MRQPTKFGKYLLLERIAVGGMAEVFVAKAFGAEGFERLLAIKKILPTMGEDAEFIAMFVDEARIAVQLSHANIVQVLELGKHDENLYIAMEYISGRDLRQLIERFRKRNQPMPIPQACLIVAEVCEALDYAHRKRDAAGRPLGIVHRDVSPQNVLVSFDGDIKLIDFGIAKAESRLQKTQAGILKGKFSYMSPEQVKGMPIDGRSDVFAAGILLWELICGEKLFTGDSDFAILEKVRNGIVPAPRSVTRTCPEGLEKVILKALANDPANRYQSASELHDDLMRFTLLGDMVYGHRQLAEWLREEFAQDWEKEQARMRAWLDLGHENSEVTPSEPRRRAPRMVASDVGITPLDPFPGPALMNAIDVQSSERTEQFRITPDNDTLALPPTPPQGVTALRTPPPDSHELPTMKMDDEALVEAEKEYAARSSPDKPPAESDTRILTSPAPPPEGFELNAEDRTRAVRRLRSSPMMRPVKADPQKTSRKLLAYVGTPLALAIGAAAFFVLQPEDVRPGKIVVTPSPSISAELFIDGRPSGPLPPFVHTVAAGSHRVEVRADGYKAFQTRVDVPPGGKPVEIEAQLISEGPMQVEPVVMTQPRPETAPRAEPPKQKHAASRTPKPKPPAVAEKPPSPVVAQATPVAVPISPPPPAPVAIGYLTAATRPAARLTIDGRDTGRWTPVPPANPIALPAGAHTVVFETADGRRLEERLQIEAGKTARLIRSLP